MITVQCASPQACYRTPSTSWLTVICILCKPNELSKNKKTVPLLSKVHVLCILLNRLITDSCDEYYKT